MSADVLLSRETPDGDRLELRPTATLVPRSASPVRVPESSANFFGYVEQSSRLAELVERGTPATVGIWGPGGVGKTELLVRAAGLSHAAWPDGRVLLSVRDAGAEDIIALLCDAVFQVDDPRLRPPVALCGAALAERRMIVAIDDLRSSTDLAALQAALASSLLFITTPRPWNVAGVEWIGLHGLTSHGVSVLRNASGREVPGDLAVAVVHSLEGNPSRIARAARLGIPLETVVTACSSAAAFDELSVARARETLSPGEQLELAALATFGEAALGPQGAPATLVKAGFLERTPVGWAVPDGLRERAAEFERDAGRLAATLLERLAGRERQSATNVLAAVPGLLAVVECDGMPASEAGRAVTAMLDRYGLWAASSEMCEALRILARKLEDPATWAWAMHQLGARRACAGDGEAARALFAGALAARQFNGDEAGCAVTVANLALLSGTAESAAPESVAPEMVAPERAVPEDGARAARPVPVPTVAVAAEPQPEAVLLPPERATARPWQGPPPRRTPPTPVAFALAIGAVVAVVTLLLWLAMRQSDEQQTAAALAGASPRPAARASAPAVAPPAAKTALPRPAQLLHPAAPRSAKPQTAAPLPPLKAGPRETYVRQAALRSRSTPSKRAHVMGKVRVSLLSILPETITPHESAILCISAIDADELYVTSIGDLPPRETTCRIVSPAATTTYEVQAINRHWRTTRSIVLRVLPATLP
jgi:hypothetical protein